MPSRPRAAETRKSIATKDRILEAARILFNGNGVPGTAVFRIADEIGMSPGNLTYHFRSKVDLVRELAQALAARMERTLLDLRAPLEPADVITHLEDVLQALWAYRFLFNSAIEVARMDIDIAVQLAFQQDRVRAMLLLYFQEAIARGEMRQPAQPDGIALLCDNAIALWMQWLQDESVREPGREDVGAAALRNCLRHYLSLIDPYVGRGFAERSWAEIARRYADAEA